MHLSQYLGGRCIRKVYRLTAVLLLPERQFELDSIDLTLGDLCLHVDFILSQLTSPQGIVSNELLLHGAVLHDRFTVVTIFGDLLLKCRYFLLLLALELFFICAGA